MSKNKILFVDNSTRCFTLFRLSIAKAFIKKGYEVYVMSPEPYEFYVDKIKEIGAIHIPYRMNPNISLFGDLRLFYHYYSVYKKIHPDYIIHYTIKPNIYGTFAAKLNKCISFSVIPGTGSLFSKGGIISNLIIILYKIAFLFSLKVWVLNKDDYNIFVQKRIVQLDKLEILPSEGINLHFYKPTCEYRKHSPFVFLYMGRMLREKGVEYIVKASRLLKSKGINYFEVHLLGLVDGLSKGVIPLDEIRKWESEGIVHFLGSVPDVRDEIEKADCVLLPTFYGEGVPRSLMEACAMKRVVLASDNVGCRDVVENGINGLLCRPQDVEDLAKKMERIMLMSENELKLMGENGRKKIEIEFQEDLIIQKYFKAILGL